MSDIITKLTKDVGYSIGNFSARRLGKAKENGNPRLVMVNLCSVWDKRRIMSARFSLRNCGHEGIFINEDLSKEQAILFYEARMARKAETVVSAWTENGATYVRVAGKAAPVKIEKKEDLTVAI